MLATMFSPRSISGNIAMLETSCAFAFLYEVCSPTRYRKIPHLSNLSCSPNMLNLPSLTLVLPEMRCRNTLRIAHIRAHVFELRIAVLHRDPLAICGAVGARDADLVAVVDDAVAGPGGPDGEGVVVVAEVLDDHVDRGVLLAAGDGVVPVFGDHDVGGDAGDGCGGGVGGG